MSRSVPASNPCARFSIALATAPSSPLLQAKPEVCKDVWMSSANGDFGGAPIGHKAGNLSAGWAAGIMSAWQRPVPKFTFVIYTHKLLNGSILLSAS